VPKLTAADVAIDHDHCRAICNEIGERLRYMLNRETLSIPQHLLALVRRLDELDSVPVVLAPSIVPSIEETLFPDVTGQAPKRRARVK
jgi:hypothetical protein